MRAATLELLYFIVFAHLINNIIFKLYFDELKCKIKMTHKGAGVVALELSHLPCKR